MQVPDADSVLANELKDPVITHRQFCAPAYPPNP